MNGNRKAVFLDRDGCVNVEDHYIRDIKRFCLYPDTLESIKALNDAGFAIVVVTNQSGVARGYMTEELVNEVHELLLKMTREAGVIIDSIEYCPHHPEGVVEKYAMKCDCRKPAPGMALRAAKELGINTKRSYVVGDKISDMELGFAIGAKTVLVRTGFGEREAGKIERGEAAPPNHVAKGIGPAVAWILDDV
ncbi:D-glycero-D-manno-heptose 1,7-bisphosphate phosphatase [hydrothermal vent metagenome]|uniref:D,D-heptose 1,7-bisphosphate phosphatase n=1 Tax=hydrothermal vent metagenome TaxID=652676 RepID=A0A3B1C8X3_9ZZZZ